MDKKLENPGQAIRAFDEKLTGQYFGGYDCSDFELLDHLSAGNRLLIDGVQYPDFINYMARMNPGRLSPVDYVLISGRVFENGHEVIIHVYANNPFEVNIEKGVLGHMSSVLTFMTGMAFYIPDDRLQPIQTRMIDMGMEWIKPFSTYVDHEGIYRDNWLYAMRLKDEDETEEVMFIDLNNQPDHISDHGVLLYASIVPPNGVVFGEMLENDKWLYHSTIRRYSDTPMLMTTIQEGPGDQDNLAEDFIEALRYAFDKQILTPHTCVEDKIYSIFIDGKLNRCHIKPLKMSRNTEEDPISVRMTKIINETIINNSLDAEHHPIYMVVLLDENGNPPNHPEFDAGSGRGQFTAESYPIN